MNDGQACSHRVAGWPAAGLRDGGKRDRTYDLPMVAIGVQVSSGGVLEARRRAEKGIVQAGGRAGEAEVGAAKRVWRRGNVMCLADSGRAGSTEDGRGYYEDG
jgi:hypothetical protein